MLIKIDLSEHLGEGQFINMLHPKALPWKAQKAIAKAAAEGGAENLEANVKIAEVICINALVNGHVLTATGRPINFPLTAESLDEMPSIVIELVADKFAQLKGGPTEKKS